MPIMPGSRFRNQGYKGAIESVRPLSSVFGILVDSKQTKFQTSREDEKFPWVPVIYAERFVARQMSEKVV